MEIKRGHTVARAQHTPPPEINVTLFHSARFRIDLLGQELDSPGHLGCVDWRGCCSVFANSLAFDLKPTRLIRCQQGKTQKPGAPLDWLWVQGQGMLLLCVEGVPQSDWELPPPALCPPQTSLRFTYQVFHLITENRLGR